ncbi:hypothetical protein EV401DRAFT_1190088 [Pisolithus croceorrhizus]|nr:hypothetical protein EV401DRAFT_1190088 [Pisolithus croceorrhizus]
MLMISNDTTAPMNPTSVTSVNAKHALGRPSPTSYDGGRSHKGKRRVVGRASQCRELPSCCCRHPASHPLLAASHPFCDYQHPQRSTCPFACHTCDHHSSPSSTLTPLSSPARAQYDPEVDESEGSLQASTPAVNNAVLSIPLESPLAGRACLEEARTGVHSDCNMEWRMFLLDWHLSYVS